MARRENESDETLYARERLSLFCETSSSFSINSLFRFFSTQFFLLSLCSLFLSDGFLRRSKRKKRVWTLSRASDGRRRFFLSLSLFLSGRWGRVFFNATRSAVVLDVALMLLLPLLLHVVLLLQHLLEVRIFKKKHFSYSSFSSSSSDEEEEEEEEKEEENNQSFSNFSNPSTRTRLPPASRISLARSSLLEPGFSPIKSMSVDLASEEETEPPRRSMSRWISERVFEDVGNVPVMQTF